MQDFTRQERRVITKRDFPSLLGEAWKKGYRNEIGIRGFRKAGIIPFDPAQISAKSLEPSWAFTECNDDENSNEGCIDLDTTLNFPSTHAGCSPISVDPDTSSPPPVQNESAITLPTSSTSPVTTSTPSTSGSSILTPTSGSSTSLRDVLCELLTPKSSQRPKLKRKQLVGIGQSLTSEEAMQQIREVEEEKEQKIKEREEKKKEREEKKKEREKEREEKKKEREEKKRRNDTQKGKKPKRRKIEDDENEDEEEREEKRKIDTQKGKKPKAEDDVAVTRKSIKQMTHRCILCQAAWYDDDPEVWVQCQDCEAWSHASCAGYDTEDDIDNETFICCN